MSSLEEKMTRFSVLTARDVNKDLTPKDQDKDKDLKYVLKDKDEDKDHS